MPPFLRVRPRTALLAVLLAMTGPSVATTGAASAPAVPTSAVSTTPVGSGGYVALDPVRLYDSAGNPPPDGDTSQWPHLRQLRVTGRAGVPATDVSAVLLNVTVANTQQPGYLTVFPAGSPQPTASNLNWTARGTTTADLVLAKVGTDGLVSFVQSGYDVDTRLVVDLAGYVVGGPADAGAGDVLPLTPQRVLDTRVGLGRDGTAPVPAGQTVHLQVAGRGGVPAGAGAALLTVTVTGPAASGYVTAYPDGSRQPLASNLNYTRNQTVPNLVLARLSVDGKVALTTSATAHLVADVAGWVPPGTATAPGALTGLAPSRLLDTRSGNGTPAGAVVPGSTVHLQVTGRGGVPAGAGSVVLNVTATGASAPGYVTVHPDGTTPPLASNLNYARGQTVANLVVAHLSPDGMVALSVAGGATHLVADVAGWAASGWGLDSYVKDDGPWTGTVAGDVLPDTRSLQLDLPPATAPSDAPAENAYARWADGDCDVTTGGCVAVGTYGVSDGNRGMVAVRSPGSADWSSWTVYPGELTDVRCPGAGHCYATGFENLGPVTPVVDIDVASGTATPVAMDLPVRIRTRAIDCTGPSACVAVGGIDDSNPGGVWTVALHDGSWTATRTAVPPATNGLAPPVHVRCRPGGSLCMVYGATSNLWPGARGLLLAVRDGVPGTPTMLAPTATTTSGVADVACWSDSGCLAVGTSDGGSTNNYRQPLAYQGDGDTWTPVTVPMPSGLYGGALGGVDCLPTGHCVAGGAVGYRFASSYFGTNALVLTGRANDLHALTTLAPSSPPFFTSVDDVMCAASARCYLLGATTGGSSPAPFVLHEPVG